MSVIEIAFNADANRNVYFQPLGRALRGRMDVATIQDGAALQQNWPLPIPGQRLGVNVKDSTGYLHETLRDDSHQIERELIEKRGFALPEHEKFEGVNVADWADKMQKIVDAGEATLTKGKFPEDLGKLPGNVIESYVRPDAKSDRDTLAAAIREQTAMFAQLVKTLSEK